MRHFSWIIGSAVCFLLLGSCAVKGIVTDIVHEEEPESMQGEEEKEEVEEREEEGEEETYLCKAPGHEHETGRLTAEYEQGTLVRWRCILSAHHICTAPLDGVWTECTYPPSEQWPEPVDPEILENPPPEKVEGSSPEAEY